MIEQNYEIAEAFDINISPVGWYSTAILLRFETEVEDEKNLNRRCLAWENYHIIKAENPEEAYEKAVKLGKSYENKYKNTEGENVRWIFEGLTMLVPIYEELHDGAEIGWTEHENKAVKTIKGFVKPKEKLEVFERNE
jgi:hypothetical protein